MGSGLMGQYSTLMGIPYIGLNCEQTLKSSFAANLADFAEEQKCFTLELLGLANTHAEYVRLAVKQMNLWKIKKVSALEKNQQLYKAAIKKIADQHLMTQDYVEIIKQHSLA